MSLIEKKRKIRKNDTKINKNLIYKVKNIKIDNNDANSVEKILLELNNLLKDQNIKISLLKLTILKIKNLFVNKTKKIVFYKPFNKNNFMNNIINILNKYNDFHLIDDIFFIISNLLYKYDVFLNNEIDLLNFKFNEVYISNYLFCIFNYISYEKLHFTNYFFANLTNFLYEIKLNEKLFLVLIYWNQNLIKYQIINIEFINFSLNKISIIDKENYIKNKLEIYELLFWIYYSKININEELVLNLINTDDLFIENETVLLQILKFFIEYININPINEENAYYIYFLNYYLNNFFTLKNENLKIKLLNFFTILANSNIEYLNKIIDNKDFWNNLVSILKWGGKNKIINKIFKFIFSLYDDSNNDFYIYNFINENFINILKEYWKLNEKIYMDNLLNLIEFLFSIGDDKEIINKFDEKLIDENCEKSNIVMDLFFKEGLYEYLYELLFNNYDLKFQINYIDIFLNNYN